MTALEVFTQSNGEVTKAYYEELRAIGPVGCLALNLFRAQKTSSRAKRYRGRQYRNASYDVKAYSVENICRLLMENRCEWLSVSSWGWQQDPEQFRNTWVLYVDIPQGQVSFHSPVRYEGPEYPGAWDGAHLSRERILAFCDEVEQWRNRNQLRFPLAIAAESY